MKITETRVVVQEWYETEFTKNGWDSNDWIFMDSRESVIGSGYDVVKILDSDKWHNPILGIAEKETEVSI